MEEIQKRNMIITKARNIIETGRGERLTAQEVDSLKDFGGIVFVAYQKAVDYLDKEQEIGGINYEREL